MFKIKAIEHVLNVLLSSVRGPKSDQLRHRCHELLTVYGFHCEEVAALLQHTDFEEKIKLLLLYGPTFTTLGLRQRQILHLIQGIWYQKSQENITYFDEIISHLTSLRIPSEQIKQLLMAQPCTPCSTTVLVTSCDAFLQWMRDLSYVQHQPEQRDKLVMLACVMPFLESQLVQILLEYLTTGLVKDLCQKMERRPYQSCFAREESSESLQLQKLYYMEAWRLVLVVDSILLLSPKVPVGFARYTRLNWEKIDVMLYGYLNQKMANIDCLREAENEAFIQMLEELDNQLDGGGPHNSYGIRGDKSNPF